MSRPRTAFILTAASVGLGAAAISVAVAHGDDTAPLPPWNWQPPGIGGDLENVEFGPSGIWSSYDRPFTITDNGMSDGNVLGTYDTHQSSFTALIYNDQSFQASNSVGAAPPDGTVWDYATFGFPTGFGGAYPFLNHYTSGPDGTADWFQVAGLGFQNVFLSTPERTADYVGIGTTVFPLFDTAGTPLDASTTTELFDVFDTVSL